MVAGNIIENVRQLLIWLEAPADAGIGGVLVVDRNPEDPLAPFHRDVFIARRMFEAEWFHRVPLIMRPSRHCLGGAFEPQVNPTNNNP
jgi:hypothetical protein